MNFFEDSKYYSLYKPTYVNLRWIAILGQLITVYVVNFYFNFEFSFLLSNIAILIGVFSNIYLLFFYKGSYLSNKLAFFILNLDIFQLGFLLFLTGGVSNPFVIFLILPCVFSSSNLDIKTNFLLVSETILFIIFLTFFNYDLPWPISESFLVSDYYYYSIPFSLFVALIFLNYFGLKFGAEARIRKEALNKMEEIMAKEHELLSLGGQAAAAAHSFGTPFSTIKIIAQELLEQFKDDANVKKDLELLVSQIQRCNQILKKLTLNPITKDDFVIRNITIENSISEIIKSFEEISEKIFIFNFDKDAYQEKINNSVEIIYGLRNFIGNANKYSNEKIYITLIGDINFTKVIIEDDGEGLSNEILNKIGQPYLNNINKEKSGLGLGIFIGKTLLEKNFANLRFDNSKKYGGAKVEIIWKNLDLKKI
ncbi:MAG: two-component sensor histidine kinase [Candidatus Pelagibacter sp. TMED275]|nr:MAG: two-component sensor histidine kinase [Candidatus Pelagibacter sp. TMED275]|tara:strand:+ start:1345 stop:2616 length:1272 start_codon:yes stop_codon:yes gene_type:complete